MRIYTKKILLLLCLLLPGFITMAQMKIEHAENTQGKLTRKQNQLAFIRSFKALPDAKATSLAKTADKILDEICRMKQLNPPIGFNADANVATYDLELKEKAPFLKVFCYLRYLIKDTRTGQIKKSLDGADIYFDINGFGIFSQMGNYWQDCDKLKFPLFFEEIPLSDSTNDYIAFNYKGNLRMIPANNKPLFIPLTRKEFLQFLIARGNALLKSDEESIKTEQQGEADLKKLMNGSDVKESDKAVYADGIKRIEDVVMQFQNNVKRDQQLLQQYNTFMSAMPPQDAAAPARVDYNNKSDAPGLMGGLEQLVSVGRKEGLMLTKVNPDYYNHSPNAPVAQLITIYYAWPTVGYEEKPDYLQQATIDIFNQLDYHALKMSMQ